MPQFGRGLVRGRWMSDEVGYASSQQAASVWRARMQFRAIVFAAMDEFFVRCEICGARDRATRVERCRGICGREVSDDVR